MTNDKKTPSVDVEATATDIETPAVLTMDTPTLPPPTGEITQVDVELPPAPKKEAS